MSTNTKWFMSTMQGAPRLSGTAGDVIALLDAVLVNGFNVTAPDSLSVADGVASLYYSGGGHGYLQHQVIEVSGATPSSLNGEWRVIEATATHVRFAAPGEADGTASGTIGVKTAPLGWEKVFSGTNKGVYRSTDFAGARKFLRVDDTEDRYAYARGYDDMTDVDTGTAPFPTEAQSSFGVTWPKSNVASTEERPWTVIGDTRLMYYFQSWHSSYQGRYDGNLFGEIESFKAGDAYASVIAGSQIQAPSSPSNYFIRQTVATGRYLSRNMSQIGDPIRFYWLGSSATPYSGLQGSDYPSEADGALYLHEPCIAVDGESSVAAPRGVIPGMAQCIQTTPLTHGAIVQHGSDFLMLVAAASSTTEGRVAIHITRQWR